LRRALDREASQFVGGMPDPRDARYMREHVAARRPFAAYAASFVLLIVVVVAALYRTVGSAPAAQHPPTATAGVTPASTPTQTALPTAASATQLLADNFDADPVGSAPGGWTATDNGWSVLAAGSNRYAADAKAGEHALYAGSSSWTDYTVSDRFWLGRNDSRAE